MDEIENLNSIALAAGSQIPFVIRGDKRFVDETVGDKRNCNRKKS